MGTLLVVASIIMILIYFAEFKVHFSFHFLACHVTDEPNEHNGACSHPWSASVSNRVLTTVQLRAVVIDIKDFQCFTHHT